VDVGLHYLTLARTMPTLSGGESQRIRLAGQVGRALTGVLYVLDEPTIGLHPRDNGRLLVALRRLRDLGNTVILVEHDREVLEAADRLFDFGPGAGRFGGTIVGEGAPGALKKSPTSLTGKFLAGKEEIAIPEVRRVDSTSAPPGGGWLEIHGGADGAVGGEGDVGKRLLGMVRQVAFIAAGEFIEYPVEIGCVDSHTARDLATALVEAIK
jgi:excinuclease ABC subunit A